MKLASLLKKGTNLLQNFYEGSTETAKCLVE
jgi:hypothetical protein